MKKTKVAIIGTGNIGTDLLIKIQRSPYLECVLFTGQNIDSKGIRFAKKIGINTSIDSIKALIKNPDLCQIVFDATSAQAHKIHAPILKKLGKFTIDLTPSRIGKMCIPVLNLGQCLQEDNVNMITCGGQAMTPIAHAILKAQPQTSYIEIVGSIASKSAGMGTRNNIDEYTQTTAESIKYFAKTSKSKAIIILNPAEPPVNMHNTLYAEIQNPNLKEIRKAVKEMVEKIKQYVPGYKVILEPVIQSDRLIFMNEVVGLGDYLPAFAGNLDIINCAALKVAEEYSIKQVVKSSPSNLLESTYLPGKI